MLRLLFRHRLMQEIYCLLQSPRYKENLFMKTIKMHQTPVSANCTSWLGGTVDTRWMYLRTLIFIVYWGQLFNLESH